jgi:hypothetical protein
MVPQTLTSAVLYAVLSAVLSSSVSAPQQRTAAEHDVKAAFLYNFTRFVSWPAGIPPESEPFRICVVAEPTITQAVERTMAGETIQGRPAQTRVPASPAEVKTCQLLFIGRVPDERAEPLVAAARESPVLVVGEGEKFPERGGAIGFVIEDGKVRFDVNSGNAQRSGLTVSSRLLNAARRTDIRK